MVSKKERVVNTREIFPENKGKQAPDRSIGRAPDNFCRRFALGKIWILAYVLNYLLRDFNPVGAVKNFIICAVRSYFADMKLSYFFISSRIPGLYRQEKRQGCGRILLGKTVLNTTYRR